MKNRAATGGQATTITVQSVAGTTLSTNSGLATVTSIGDPNSALAQTVNVCTLTISPSLSVSFRSQFARHDFS